MRGLLAHFKLTLGLNFRSRQAIVYGYLVPIFFLIAFGSIFRSSNPPLLRQLGQLLTISVLGGACFGMPTAMVAERERGVWRRYRLLPTSTGSLVISTIAVRFVIVLSAAVMQIILAGLMYGMPMPHHPLQMAGAFVGVTFAFLGMGLVIAMLADSVPAVQALGQVIFLPMIMIGGVGVPLWTLPAWAQHVAGYLPGKYAVQTLQACATGEGLGHSGFDMMALMVIGIAACVAGARMFRWDAHEKPDPRRRGWVVLALCAWLSVGLVAEYTNQVRLEFPSTSASAPSTAETTAPVSQSGEPFETIAAQQIDAIPYDGLPDDDTTITPIAPNLDHLDANAIQRVAEFRRQLAAWPAGNEASLTRRVENLLCAAGVADITEDPYEGIIAYIIFEKLQAEIPRDTLEKVLVWIIFHPSIERPILTTPELGVEGPVPADQLRERVRIYAIKLLGRLTGKRTYPGRSL